VPCCHSVNYATINRLVVNRIKTETGFLYLSIVLCNQVQSGKHEVGVDSSLGLKTLVTNSCVIQKAVLFHIGPTVVLVFQSVFILPIEVKIGSFLM